MKSHPETTLATLPSDRDNERLLVVLCQESDQGSYLELRQQSWGEGVGWFTQSSVRVEPEQVAQLRGALGSGKAKSSAATVSWKGALRNNPAQRESFPRVLRADSA